MSLIQFGHMIASSAGTSRATPPSGKSQDLDKLALIGPFAVTILLALLGPYVGRFARRLEVTSRMTVPGASGQKMTEDEAEVAADTTEWIVELTQTFAVMLIPVTGLLFAWPNAHVDRWVAAAYVVAAVAGFLAFLSIAKVKDPSLYLTEKSVRAHLRSIRQRRSGGDGERAHSSNWCLRALRRTAQWLLAPIGSLSLVVALSVATNLGAIVLILLYA